MTSPAKTAKAVLQAHAYAFKNLARLQHSINVVICALVEWNCPEDRVTAAKANLSKAQFAMAIAGMWLSEKNRGIQEFDQASCAAERGMFYAEKAYTLLSCSRSKVPVRAQVRERPTFEQLLLGHNADF